MHLNQNYINVEEDVLHGRILMPLQQVQELPSECESSRLIDKEGKKYIQPLVKPGVGLGLYLF